MKLFGARKTVPDTIITTPLPALTGTFVDKSGAKVAPSSVADFKVPISAINQVVHIQGFFSDTYVQPDTFADALTRASDGDLMITARQLDTVAATLDTPVARQLRARIIDQATNAAASPPASQALEQIQQRRPVVQDGLTSARDHLEQRYNDIARLRPITSDLAKVQAQITIMAAIASAFPNDAQISAAVTTLTERASAITTALSGRVAAIENLERSAPARNDELDALNFEARKPLIDRAHVLKKGGWLFKDRPYASASDVAPEQLFTQLRQVGEVHVLHPKYKGTATAQTYRSLPELKDFLIREAGK